MIQDTDIYAYIFTTCVVGLLYSLYNYYSVKQVDILGQPNPNRQLLDDRQKN